jgi:hypothetical protein
MLTIALWNDADSLRHFLRLGGSSPDREDWFPAGQIPCSAKLTDQSLQEDFQSVKAERPVSVAPIGSFSVDCRNCFWRPDFRYWVREAVARSTASGGSAKRRIDGARGPGASRQRRIQGG